MDDDRLLRYAKIFHAAQQKALHRARWRNDWDDLTEREQGVILAGVRALAETIEEELY